MHNELRDAIREIADQATMPDADTLPVLTVAQTETLAIRFGVLYKSVEITALENGILPLRYARNFHTFNWNDQIRLLQSQVTVVGLGGLGGTLVELLARAGVGAMILVDDDVFEDHNLNRQLFSSHASLGMPKADAALDRIHAVNPSVEVTVFDRPFTSADGPHLVDNSRVVVDCLDDIATRFDLQEAARDANVPFVSAAVAGLAGHITTIFPKDTGLELIYGPAGSLKKTKGAETRLGCMPQGVATIAAIESAETIKVLLDQEQNTLRNKLLIVDLADNRFDLVHLI
jgi:molybdopterin/thiamine biosynthesis adenylyltransferase